jgi:membrane protein
LLDFHRATTEAQLPDDQSARGREADRPTEVPRSGWKDILWRSWQEVSDNNIFLVSGGVTYAMVLALFPGLAALVSIYGLMLDPGQIEKQVGALAGVLPQRSQQMLSEELHQLASSSGGALGVGAIIGILLALWSASRGMSGLMSAMDIAYEARETRSFFKFNMIALLLTLGAIAGGLIAIALIAVLPTVAQFLAGGLKWEMTLIQWPVLIVLVMIGLALLYRYAPNRDEPQWRWVSPGAITATAVWILGSVLFTVYVTNFNSYNKTYGSLGGVVVLLTWLYLSAFAVLLGAVINAQSERQTPRAS